MQTMIFDIDLAGHHMEYLHHIYAGALRNKEEKYFIFLLSSKTKRDYMNGKALTM